MLTPKLQQTAAGFINELIHNKVIPKIAEFKKESQ